MGYTRVKVTIHMTGISKPIEFGTSDIKFNEFSERVRIAQRTNNAEYINFYDEQGENPMKVSPLLIAAMWSNKL